MQLNSNSSVLILSHFYTRAIHGGGPPQEIRDFCLPRVKRVVYIEHPFPYADDHRSSVTVYENGQLIKTIFTFSMAGPAALWYGLDIFLTLYLLGRVGLWQVGESYQLCVALDNLNTVSVLVLRKLGMIKKLVYYTIDYTPIRFAQPVLNWLYHWMDRVACYQSDAIWVLSERMTAARRANGVQLKKSAPVVLLPMGAKLSRIKVLPIEKIHPYQLIFVGHLLEKQGLQQVIKALPRVLAQLPKVELLVVGQGEYLLQLKKLVRNLNLQPAVQFTGFVKSHAQVEKMICQSAIGIATYQPGTENYTFYTDPGKPKLYLGCGLPVVITAVPAIAEKIKHRRAGVVVDYSVKSIENAIVKLLSNTSVYKQYRQRALQLGKEYDTDVLIAKALSQTK